MKLCLTFKPKYTFKKLRSNLSSNEANCQTTREWRTYHTQKRTIKHLYHIATEIQPPNQMLVSTNPGFPVADSVFSRPMSGGNIDTTQDSWQDDRPFTLRALYRFRRHYLKVPDSISRVNSSTVKKRLSLFRNLKICGEARISVLSSRVKIEMLYYNVSTTTCSG